MLYVGWMDESDIWDGWMVIIGHRSANKKTHLITLVLSAFDFKTEN